MKSILKILFYTIALFMAFQTLSADSAKPRILVLTDISNEPDDEESMVRFLVYANEYDVEGLVATTSVWLQDKTREDLIRRQIDAYEKVRPNLLKHRDGYPEAEALRAVTCTGQPGFGMASVGEGQSTAGSQLIIETVDKPDARPVWITAWGGSNTLAQALWDVKYSRTPEELAKFISKIRVYTISDQDNAGRWMRITFPELFFVVTPSSVYWNEYYKATWTGIAGDKHYQNGPMHHFELVDNPWLEKNIMKNHGPLGELYPHVEYIMEGDTPSFLWLINNGLGSHLSPAYGGWGGRYALEKVYGEIRPIWTNSRDRVQAEDKSWHTTAQATIWRWREAYQYDFAARMDWCVAENYEDANHNPVLLLNGDETKDIVEINAAPGTEVTLSAEGSRDPDGDKMKLTWFQYKEAGTCPESIQLSKSKGMKTSFVVPEVKEAGTIHVILQARDNGKPNLFSYRRAIFSVKP